MRDSLSFIIYPTISMVLFMSSPAIGTKKCRHLRKDFCGKFPTFMGIRGWVESIYNITIMIGHRKVFWTITLMLFIFLLFWLSTDKSVKRKRDFWWSTWFDSIYCLLACLKLKAVDIVPWSDNIRETHSAVKRPDWPIAMTCRVHKNKDSTKIAGSWLYIYFGN